MPRSGRFGMEFIVPYHVAIGVNAAANLAVMVRPVDGAAELEMLLSDQRFNAVAIGPGARVGAGTRELVMASLRGERAVVIDADGLTSFAQPDGTDDLFAALAANGKAILTPHAGEFHRLFGSSLPAGDGAKTGLAFA